MIQPSSSYVNYSSVDKNDYFSMDNSLESFITQAGEKMMGPIYPVNTIMLKFLDLFLFFSFCFFRVVYFYFSLFFKSFYNSWPKDLSPKMSPKMCGSNGKNKIQVRERLLEIFARCSSEIIELEDAFLKDWYLIFCNSKLFQIPECASPLALISLIWVKKSSFLFSAVFYDFRDFFLISGSPSIMFSRCSLPLISDEVVL